MPSTFSFALLAPGGGVSSGTSGVIPAFPGSSVALSGSRLACNEHPFDKQHFLDLFDRIYPFEYIQPLKNNRNAGYEIYQGAGALGARLSLAVNRLECCLFILFAEGGARATVPLEFSRPTADAGAVTVKAGTRVTTASGNRQFITTEDAVFEALDLGPIVANGMATAQGYEWNVTGKVITPISAIVLEGDIATVQSMTMDPPAGDFTIVVENLLDATGGRPACLDGLGDNRGLRRATGEQDPQYRLRLRSLPDTVSPAAMIRAAERTLAGARKTLDHAFCETFEHAYQEVYDAPSPNAGTPSYDGGVPPLNVKYNGNTFVYDDPRLVTTVDDFCRNRTMDEAELRGAFIVVVPNNVTLVDVGMAYDDPGTVPGDFLDSGTGARRGTPAYDITNDDNVLIMTGAYDGFDLERGALYAGLFAELQRIKPAGVAAIIETIRP